MSNDNGRFSQKYISSRFLFSFFENEPSEFWRYLREKKSKGRFFAFFFLLANNACKENRKEKLKDCIWGKFSSSGEFVYVLYMWLIKRRKIVQLELRVLDSLRLSGIYII